MLLSPHFTLHLLSYDLLFLTFLPFSICSDPIFLLSFFYLLFLPSHFYPLPPVSSSFLSLSHSSSFLRPVVPHSSPHSYFFFSLIFLFSFFYLPFLPSHFILYLQSNNLFSSYITLPPLSHFPIFLFLPSNIYSLPPV